MSSTPNAPDGEAAGKTAVRAGLLRPRTGLLTLLLAVLLAVLALGVAVAVLWGPGPTVPTAPTAEPAHATAAEAFSATHWATPIPPQGPAPPHVAAPARGTAPEDCAGCHYRQYLDWRESWHAGAMGPGVWGQFPGLDAAGRGECLRCHAPLSEQWAAVPPGEGAPDGDWNANPAFAAALERRGITCAACHLRRHVRHAPPLDAARAAAQGTPQAAGAAGAEAVTAGTLLHGAPVRSSHFLDSAFCAGCHQHQPSALHVNGKAIENTYREWQESPAAAEGRSCQSCHMPGGRHLWRGIHDPETTRAGVTLAVRVEPPAPRTGSAVQARLTLTNSGVGHAFPTYTTPAVYLRAAFLDAQGRVLPGQFAERLLQRRLDMGTNPWSEQFDTRLAPGATTALEFAGTVPAEAATLYLWVWVEPDHFYAGFYRDWLAGGGDFDGAADLRRALRNAEDSAYLLYGRRIAIVAAP